jgi:hypothetical protein
MSETYTPLLEEPLEFNLTLSGNNYYNLFFRGPKEALDRMLNFCLGYGVSKDYFELSDNHYYVLTPMSRLKSALLNCFRGEIVKAKNENINYICSYVKDELGDVVEVKVQWDEDKLNELAAEKIELFLQKCGNQDFTYSVNQHYAEEYSLGTIFTQEQEKITE